MPTLLQLDTSPLSTSISRELTAEFARTWQAANPSGRVIYRDLATAPPAPIDGAWIGASYTPEEKRTPEQRALLALSDELIAELEQADTIAIGVAMHNFNIPSVLKLWVDQIARKGRTFSYGADGARGLLTGKKAIVLTATGGVYEPGTPLGGMNFIEPYLKALLGFLGIKDTRFITVGGVARLQSGAVDRATLLAPAIETVRATAA
jgi:FMN-dependent NADH-azoreductase